MCIYLPNHVQSVKIFHVDSVESMYRNMAARGQGS